MQRIHLEALDSFREQEPLAVELLSRAWQNNRLSHAYIFTGKNEDVSIAFVTTFARILLCEHQTGNDNCRNCQVFINGQHPDFRIWAPSEKSKILKLEQVKQLISATSKKPVSSHHQVLVLQNAQMLNVQSANALLKTLEEPASYTTIILTVDSLDHVLTTILSRCQIIPLKSLEVIREISSDFNLNEYLPDSFQAAAALANKTQSIPKEELQEILKIIQNQLWEKSKFGFSEAENLLAQIKILEKLENYIDIIERHVNHKLILDNLFITLFQAKKVFNL